MAMVWMLKRLDPNPKLKEVDMGTVIRSSGWYTALALGLVIAGCLLGGPRTALAHGGKTHGEEPFSAFQAVQKAVQLYDRLIVAGKLAQSWETDLNTIQVTIRQTADDREYVVQFHRSAGEPPRVFFYFDRQGEYAGSNFTGE